YFVRLCEADINQNDFHTRVSFRIYRETLSRFSCAASVGAFAEQHGLVISFKRTPVGPSAVCTPGIPKDGMFPIEPVLVLGATFP
ncbi:hypothetical protein, partial [Anaeromassilibacillus sp. SJQ-1]|uniref:hypothetical protein n=1 Tax=Anaeromassilibacillus sp. SJQ-1 TaxID=3375419 RepID=UPI0039899389